MGKLKQKGVITGSGGKPELGMGVGVAILNQEPRAVLTLS